MGDYVYERFSPDRFQDFCSALLQKEYPGYQVFPVGQADGGRDGLVPARQGQRRLVIQVKFRRTIRKGDDYFSWITQAIAKELPKIERLIGEGAESYLLVTNVPGTAMAGKGTMDRVQAYLDRALSIPAQVLWRDDLDARLSNNYDLKWYFSEILATPDVIRQLLEDGLGEDSQRRQRAIKGYLKAQYEGDSSVKFKQAELQASDLLNLFVDVPGILPAVSKRAANVRWELMKMLQEILSSPEAGAELEFDAMLWRYERIENIEGRADFASFPPAPTGSMLLHPATASLLPKIVVEGAPGQGKSTLAQYVCQVHRMHFLDEQNDLRRIPAAHRLSPLRVPFKIDLRDLALWLDPNDDDDIRDQSRPQQKRRTLETFIADQVQSLSGGQEFSVSDLHALAARTPLTIVLDGFDEVATPKQRSQVVDEVDRGVARLSDDALSVQSIVTSRPSAMPDSPTFDRTAWSFLELAPIPTKLALEYAGRWSDTRKLDARERQELVDILAQKIQSPHLRDLARNPMQLTILLWLIHLRGQSLPDQRTSMYESYVEVFFNREAEKTKVVRENRQLLLDLHGYLAWKMHSEAEVAGTDGRLSATRIQALMGEWLDRRGYTESAIEDLFEGVVQRIVAIVSRVEGTFEFEVQPLREYFAAHHLYHTAPHSPVGNPESGTKPEIFTALLVNPYWQNVLRFFSGFYSIGEIPGLANQIVQRLESNDPSTPLYDRTVAINLLNDWVFHQDPRWTLAVAKAAVDELSLRMDRGRRAAPRFVAEVGIELPIECGGRYAAEFAIELLSTVANNTWSFELAEIALRHLPRREVFDRWMKKIVDEDLPVKVALTTGALLGVTAMLEPLQLDQLRERWKAGADLDKVFVQFGNQLPLRSSEFQRRAWSDAMDGNVYFGGAGGDWAELAYRLSPVALSRLLEPERYEYLMHRSDDPDSPPPPMDGQIGIVSGAVKEQFQPDDAQTHNSLEPWQRVIDSFGPDGESFTANCLAAVAAGITSRASRGAGASDLFDARRPLTERARHARMRSGSIDWWRAQHESAVSNGTVHLWAIHFFAWAKEPVVLSMRDELGQILSDVPHAQYRMIAEVAQSVEQKSVSAKRDRHDWSSEPFRLQRAMALRGNSRARMAILKNFRANPDSVPDWGSGTVLGWLLHELDMNPTAAAWKRAVDEVGALARKSLGEVIGYWDYPNRFDSSRMGIGTARLVLNDPFHMPRPFVDAALTRLARQAEAPIALAVVAAEDGWNAG